MDKIEYIILLTSPTTTLQPVCAHKNLLTINLMDFNKSSRCVRS